MEAAVETVIATIQLGIPVARVELLDEVMIDAVNRYSNLSYATKPTLLFEFHGTSMASVTESATAVQELTGERGGSDFQWATTLEDRTRLWQARHNTLYAALARRPGGKPWVTDVCVPISKLAECIVETKRDLAATTLYAPLVGHAGDGNFHLNIIIDPADASEYEAVRALNARLVQRALALGGTCTGEHGIGMGKKQYLIDEHGDDAVAVMRTLKQALDPRNLMNPGKVV
jgi:D-lactate dehydrogenase (cytochrome)